MRFANIGQQLRAYRLQSGLKAEEIAARLGVSRAALYRYEKGEVIKIETIRRLAELLNIPYSTLLGVEFSFFSRPLGYLDHISYLEDDADQLIFVGGAICPLIMLPETESFIGDVWLQSIAGSDDRLLARAAAEQTFAQLTQRSKRFQQRRPSITAVLGEADIMRLLTVGLSPGQHQTVAQLERALAAARREIASLAALAEHLPMGVQLGVLSAPYIATPFQIIRARDRAHVSVAPFAVDITPMNSLGVTIVTSADEAVVGHQRIAEFAWKNSLKGKDAAERLRQLLSLEK